MKNVLIVDDHAVMRAGLKQVLTSFHPGLNIWECANGDAMLRQFRERSIDLLIIDIHMPDTDTISLTEMVSIRFPDTYVLVFSMLPEHIYGRRMLKAGARGFLPKESSIEEIRAAVSQALEQKNYLSNRLAGLLQDDAEQKEDNPFALLSHREFEIVNYLLAGWSINDIAAKLNLKHSTISTYKTRVFEKMQVRTVFELKELALLFEYDPPV